MADMDSAGDTLRKMGKGTGPAKTAKSAPKTGQQIIVGANVMPRKAFRGAGAGHIPFKLRPRPE